MNIVTRCALAALPAFALLGGCADAPPNPPPVAGSAAISNAPVATVVPVAPVPMIATPPVAAAPVIVAPPGTMVEPVVAPAGTTVAPMVVPGRMSTNDILATVANNTVTGISSSGQPYNAWFAQDGRLRFRQGNFQDVGSWRVTGDGRLCSMLTRINGGNEDCYFLYREGTNAIRFSTPSGTTAGTFNVIAGNPQNL